MKPHIWYEHGFWWCRRRGGAVVSAYTPLEAFNRLVRIYGVWQ